MVLMCARSVDALIISIGIVHIMVRICIAITASHARTRICKIKSFIKKRLKKAGYTSESYDEDTSFPRVMQFLTVKSQHEPKPSFDLNVEELSEADCRDILMELFS